MHVTTVWKQCGNIAFLENPLKPNMYRERCDCWMNAYSLNCTHVLNPWCLKQSEQESKEWWL